MIKIEQYKLFHNSQDFEYIYKKSIPDFVKYSFDERKFYHNNIKKAIAQKRLYLFYKDDVVMGYSLYSLKGESAFWDFDFIIKKYRRYSRICRSYMINLISKNADELIFWIHKKNVSPFNSSSKIPKYLGVEIKKIEKDIGVITAGNYFKLNLRELDKMEKQETSQIEESKINLKLGIFAPQNP